MGAVIAGVVAVAVALGPLADGSDTYTSTSTATRAFSTLKDTVDIGLGFGEDTRRLLLERRIPMFSVRILSRGTKSSHR
jgi:hypothetical protein